jgi:hypothetical protein
VETRFTSFAMASVVLLACLVAAGAARITATTTQIGVAGRANANASIASSGSFVGSCGPPVGKMASPTSMLQRAATRGARFGRRSV